MSVVTCKTGVRFKGFTPGLCRLLTVLTELASEGGADLPAALVITSANDSTHGPTSRHYRNEAIDIRSKNFTSHAAKLQFRADYEARLGPKFRVLMESVGTPNEHFHAQIKKGGTYP